MSAAAHASTIQTTRQTVTGVTYGTVASITAAALTGAGISVGTKVLVRVTAEIDSPDNIIDVFGRCAHAGVAFARSEQIIEPGTGGATFPHHYEWFTVWTTVSGEDFQFQIRATGAGNVVGADEIVLVAMSLADLTENTDWAYVEVDTDTALSLTPLTDGAAITITTPGSTDWLVMTSAQHDTVSVTVEYGSRIFSSGTINETVPICQREGEEATAELMRLGNVRVFIGLGAASQTFREESFNVGSASGTRLNSSIFILNLNKFKNRTVNWDAAEELLGTTAWADPFEVGKTFTPDVTGDAWVIAHAATTGADANIREVVYRLQIDNVDDPATQTADAATAESNQDVLDKNQFGRQTVKAVTASQTYTFDWEGHTNGIVLSVANRGLCVFSFELTAAVVRAPKRPLTLRPAPFAPGAAWRR